MIDTCRLKFEGISYSDFIHIKDNIEMLTEKKMNYNNEYNYFYSKHFKSIGFKNIILKNQKYDQTHYYHAIELELHPVHFIRPHDYISLLGYSEVDQFISRFNQEVKKIYTGLPLFQGWTLERIDYAIQFYSKYTPLYINLFQRGDRMEYLKPSYDKKSHRKKQREGSLYLKALDYITINFYDKYDELSKKHPKYEYLDQAYNLLRIEVQCHKRKIRSMQSEDFSKAISLNEFFKYQICSEVILFYYNEIIGEGKYLTLNDAKELVNKSNLKSKDKLKEVLELINTKKSIYNARVYFNKKYEQKNSKKFNRYLERLRSKNINPVTIPLRMKRQQAFAFLPNPIYYINRQLDGELPKINIYEFTESLGS